MKSLAIKIGVSSCLLGDNVRYDSGHKRDSYLTETLGAYFEWVRVCPEVEIGLGTPRESIRLEESRKKIRLVGVRSKEDHTEKMRSYSEKKIQYLKSLSLSGYILKKNSPSLNASFFLALKGQKFIRVCG